MRLRGPVLLAGLALLAAMLASPGMGSAVSVAAPGTALSGGITFDHATIVDPFRLVGEPDVAIDSQGGIYTSGPAGSAKQTSFFWKSDDGGVQWHNIGVVPEVKHNGTNGGGDTEITIDDKDNVFATDLQTLICQGAYRSLDKGKTFTQSEGCIPVTDRQWMANYKTPAGAQRIYLASNGPVGCYMLVSTDQGLTYAPTGDPSNFGTITGGDCAGKFVLDPRNGDMYVPMSGGDIVKSTDGGNTWTELGNTGAKENLFASLAEDSAGNLYQAWTDLKVAYLSVSTNGGVTWRKFQVNTPDLKQIVFPWPVAGSDGRVAMVYYATTDTGKTGGYPGSPNALWHTYAVFSTDATSATPHFRQVQVDEHVMHLGAICTGGFPGCLLNNADRSLADFFEAGIDPRDGRLYVVFNDNADVNPANHVGKAYVMVARERTGPSLLASVGSFTGTSADAALASVTANPDHTVAIAGTQGLPPGNWTTDPAGDAHWPVVPAAGPNNPALDITEASSGDDGQGNLTLKMNLADLSAVALAGSVQSLGKPAWVFTWAWNNAHYFVRWHGAGPAEYGKVGDVLWPALGAPEPSYLTYIPSGQATATVTGNTLAISVPASAVGGPAAGSKLDNLTAYTWSEKGPVPSVVDQAHSFSYLIGVPAAAQHAPDGYVQVSVDDPGFAAPITAALSPNGGFTATTGALTPGTHTIYVRQVLSADLYNKGLWDDVVAGPVATTTVTV